MHTNFYFLRQVAAALQPKAIGSVVSECFSQSKDELIVRFEAGSNSWYIRASLSPSFGSLSFPDQFQRARKNSVDLFHSIIGTRVVAIRQFQNERSLALEFSDGHMLLFKMHGNRCNAILFQGNNVIGVFRKSLKGDFAINPLELDREIDWSKEHFLNNIDRKEKIYFTFGKVVWHYLYQRGFESLSPEGKWNALEDVRRRLNDPTYYITYIEGKPILSLLESGEIKNQYQDPLRAANEFYYEFTYQYTLQRDKAQLMSVLKSRLESGKNYCEKNQRRLEEIQSDNHYKVWADVLMANLHAIAPGAEKVELENFYDNQRPIEIKLRTDLSAQKNAEIYYRKARNQHIEIERLEESIERKREEMALFATWLAEVEKVSDLRSLRALERKIQPEVEQKDTERLPYHEFLYKDFRIWVGKNGPANDELTFKHGYKEDLWLHAKDVRGSHVLVKYQSGKNFPKDVIEHAAGLAAHNSSRRNESLCPVIVTPRKYVRKRKGDAPGAVVVEREQVILVEPRKP